MVVSGSRPPLAGLILVFVLLAAGNAAWGGSVLKGCEESHPKAIKAIIRTIGNGE